MSVAKRNGKPFLSLPPGCAELAEQSEGRPLWKQERYYVNLNPIERRTWEKILRGYTISQIAREEGVSRQAILARIRGNSKDQGGMIGKNFWVLLWWLVRQGSTTPKRLFESHAEMRRPAHSSKPTSL